jgi:hypothetical protein
MGIAGIRKYIVNKVNALTDYFGSINIENIGQ